LRALCASIALACAGCADVEVGLIRWEEPEDACGIDRHPMDTMMTYSGAAQINTLIVHVLRRPGASGTCVDCVGDGLCQPVQAECRCGPATPVVEDAVRGLDDIAFEEIDLDDTYCVRVAQLDLDMNAEEGALGWTRQCDPAFDCARFLYDMPMAARDRLRVCSLTDVVLFPGSVTVANHRCREQNALGVFNCAEVDGD
jgi:hypothetical protein